MSIFSSVILARMLKALKLEESEFINGERETIKDELLALIFQIFGVGSDQKNGDEIALQYAGSEAFHKAEIYKSKEGWRPVKENITLKAIKR